MIIIVMMILFLLYRISKVKNNKDKRILINSILINVSLSIIFLILLQIEISYHDGLSGTIGTDAYSYFRAAINGEKETWKNICKIIERKNYLESKGYEILSILILKSSLFKGAIIIKVFNIILVQHIIYLSYKYIIEIKIMKKIYIKKILYLLAINGGFIFTSTRLFKDTTYIYLVLEFLTTLNKYLKKKEKKTLFKILFISYISNYFRPYSFFLNLIIVILEIIKIKKIKKIKNLKWLSLITFFGIVIVLLFSQLIPNIKNFLELRYSATQFFYRGKSESLLRNSFYSLTNQNIWIKYFMGMLRFIALPSPFRNLFTKFGTDINWFEGITGKVLIFQWSLIYYLMILPFILLVYKYHKYLYDFYSLIIFNIILSSSYALMYAGASQTRWKLSLIILLVIGYIIFLIKGTKKDKINMTICSYLLIALEFIWGIQWI